MHVPSLVDHPAYMFGSKTYTVQYFTYLLNCLFNGINSFLLGMPLQQNNRRNGAACFLERHAAGDGILPSMVQSALLQPPLMVLSTWYMEVEQKRTYTVHVTSKGSARNCTRAQFGWDSGSVIVMVTVPLMPTPAGTRCLGSTLKRCLPHRPSKRKRFIC